MKTIYQRNKTNLGKIIACAILLFYLLAWRDLIQGFVEGYHDGQEVDKNQHTQPVELKKTANGYPFY